MNPNEDTKNILIYGGCSGIGSKCVHMFKANNWWVTSIDYTANNISDVNIMVDKHDDKQTQESEVMTSLSSILQEKKLHVIICVSGGWANMHINDTDTLAEISDEMWNHNLHTSIICATIASTYLVKSGLFILSGAKSSLLSSSQLLGYEVAKAAVNVLSKNVSEKSEKNNYKTHMVALLPTVLECPNNKKTTTEADAGSNRSLQYISDLLLRWANGVDRPPNGSLSQIVATNDNTDVLIL